MCLSWIARLRFMIGTLKCLQATGTSQQYNFIVARCDSVIKTNVVAAPVEIPRGRSESINTHRNFPPLGSLSLSQRSACARHNLVNRVRHMLCLWGVWFRPTDGLRRTMAWKHLAPSGFVCSVSWGFTDNLMSTVDMVANGGFAHRTTMIRSFPW